MKKPDRILGHHSRLDYADPLSSPPATFGRQVAMAEEALRRAKAAGRLPTEGGLRAAEERIDKIRKEAKAARARRVALAKREVPAAAVAAADRASQVLCLLITYQWLD